MNIGGLQKFSLLDYPDHISAIIFTQGCNFRCQFCYNPMLVWPRKELGKFNIKPSAKAGEKIEKVDPEITEDDLFDFLEKRQKKLDAVVISGGEPTIHADLPEMIERIKALGFKVKLDTNGTNPRMLKALIAKKLLDYIAMDIKGGLSNYDLITEVQPNIRDIKKSIKQIMESDLPYEFRTTVVPELVGKKDIEETGKIIAGARKWYLQGFKSNMDLLNDRFKNVAGFTAQDMERMRKIGAEYVEYCGVR